MATRKHHGRLRRFTHPERIQRIREKNERQAAAFKPIMEMTVKELKEYALTYGIKFPKSAKKADIIETIEAHYDSPR